MPSGSKPGERRGGRPKGGLNKATREAAEREQLIAEIAAAQGKPLTPPAPAGSPAPVQRALAKDRLVELLEICIGAAAFHQPAGPGQAPNINQNWGEFRAWVDLAVRTADKAAAYQSPTFRAIAVAAAPTPLREFGRGGDDNVIPIDDPVAAARVYRRIVSGGGGR